MPVNRVTSGASAGPQMSRADCLNSSTAKCFRSSAKAVFAALRASIQPLRISIRRLGNFIFAADKSDLPQICRILIYSCGSALDLHRNCTGTT
jgi:hypothetical protein